MSAPAATRPPCASSAGRWLPRRVGETAACLRRRGWSSLSLSQLTLSSSREEGAQVAARGGGSSRGREESRHGRRCGAAERGRPARGDGGAASSATRRGPPLLVGSEGRLLGSDRRLHLLDLRDVVRQLWSSTFAPLLHASAPARWRRQRPRPPRLRATLSSTATSTSTKEAPGSTLPWRGDEVVRVPEDRRPKPSPKQG
jgi:hypothetical protein